MLTRWGGASSGVPFIAFLDSNGALVVNGLEGGRRGANIGHPFEPHEVDWFLTMLTRAAPRMAPADKLIIERYLRSQKK
jgi:hypothetical protein